MNPVYLPNACRLTGYYAGGAGHTVNILVYNFLLNIYEQKGTMLNRSTPFDYVIPLTIDNISSGVINIMLEHSAGTYIASHRLYVDYVQFDFTDTTNSIISDVVAIKNKTDQLSFTFGRLNTNTQMISDSISSADYLESNITNINMPLSDIDAKITTSINNTIDIENKVDSLNTTLDTLNIPTVSDIVTAVWNATKATQLSNDITFIKNIEGGKWEIKNNQMIFYGEDNTTEIARFNLYNENGVLSEESVVKRVRV